MFYLYRSLLLWFKARLFSAKQQEAHKSFQEMIPVWQIVFQNMRIGATRGKTKETTA